MWKGPLTNNPPYPSEHLRSREQARQEKAAGDFLDTLDRLMDEFRSIINESIDRPGIGAA